MRFGFDIVFPYSMGGQQGDFWQMVSLHPVQDFTMVSAKQWASFCHQYIHTGHQLHIIGFSKHTQCWSKIQGNFEVSPLTIASAKPCSIGSKTEIIPIQSLNSGLISMWFLFFYQNKTEQIAFFFLARNPIEGRWSALLIVRRSFSSIIFECDLYFQVVWAWQSFSIQISAALSTL